MAKITFIQCTGCGQIVQGDNPENLRRVCLECCERIKYRAKDPADPPYIIFSAEAPLEPHACPDRQKHGGETCQGKGC